MTTRTPAQVGSPQALRWKRLKEDLATFESLDYDRTLYSEEVAAAARFLLIAVRNRPQAAPSEPDTASGEPTPPPENPQPATAHAPAPPAERRAERSAPSATASAGHSRGTKRPAAGSRNGASQKKKTKRSHAASDGANGGSDTSNGHHSKMGAGGGNGSGGGSTSIPPNSEVACRVKEDGTATWILAKVRRYVSEAKKYEVTDSGDDNSKTHMVFKKHIRPLPKKAPDIESGTRVLAVYPDTTTYYAAVVKSRRNGTYVLVFDDEDEEEADIEKEVNGRHVLVL